MLTVFLDILSKSSLPCSHTAALMLQVMRMQRVLTQERQEAATLRAQVIQSGRGRHTC
jgi:hypothetical protein